MRNSDEGTLRRFENAVHAFTITRREGYEAGNELIFRYVKNGLGLK